jgi:S-adenosylmethionine-diacylgycerolhomoserine-N-methlytransferase
MAVVDFHDLGLPLFKRWMGLNHVRLDGHLLAGLKSRFPTCDWAIRPAFGGVWSYFHFIGRAA